MLSMTSSRGPIWSSPNEDPTGIQATGHSISCRFQVLPSPNLLPNRRQVFSPPSIAPKAPCRGTLRVAGPDDILRIVIVATAGFRYSPLFCWERPYHAEYPED